LAIRISILLALLSLNTLGASQEDALTEYIFKTVRDFGAKNLPDSLLPSPVLVKTTAISRLESDTLYIPEKYWGYSSTNDYRLHLCVGLIIYQHAYEKLLGEKSEINFFKSSGMALELIMKNVKSQEKKDHILEPLLIRNFLLEPYIEGVGRSVPVQDMNDPQLRFFAILRCALGYRCDTAMSSLWLNSSELPSYGIVKVEQMPRGGIAEGYDVKVTVKNKSSVVCPFELLLDLSGEGDSVYNIDGFVEDTTLEIFVKSSLLKVILDPYFRLMESDLSDNQLVSDEFNRKRKVFTMIILVFWNLFAGIAAFVSLFFAGLMIHRMSRLYLNNHTTWMFFWFVTFVLIKLTMPLTLFGFNMWGFFYYMQFAYNIIGAYWLLATSALATFITYYLSLKDGTSFIRYSAFIKWIMLFSFLEPLLSGIPLFIRL
jgi:hypothetical protein